MLLLESTMLFHINGRKRLYYLLIGLFDFQEQYTQIVLSLKEKKALWLLFMDGVQLPQGYRATTSRQFTFYH